MKIKKGDYLSRISYLKVEDVKKDYATVSNEDGLTWQIDNSILQQECVSASEYSKEEEVNRTKLIEIFSNVGDKVFTVNFNKEPKADDYLKLTRGEGNKILSFAEMKKSFSKVKGEERTLIGYMLNTENGFGRSNVIDLEIPSDQHRIRQVNHRSLNWLVLNGIKYIVKK